MTDRPIEATPPSTGEGVCDVCGGRTIEIHCRITCTACGYERDCSDP